jgi:hypothetical protein
MVIAWCNRAVREEDKAWQVINSQHGQVILLSATFARPLAVSEYIEYYQGSRVGCTNMTCCLPACLSAPAHVATRTVPSPGKDMVVAFRGTVLDQEFSADMVSQTKNPRYCMVLPTTTATIHEDTDMMMMMIG